MKVLSKAEREVAAEIADMAMISGWDNAIKHARRKFDLEDHEVRNLLDDALDYNDKADPQGRIHELEDWAFERKGRSQRARI